MTPAQRLAIDFESLTGFSRDQRLLAASFICRRAISSFKDLYPIEAEQLREFAEAWCLTRAEPASETELKLFTAARMGTASKAA